MLKKINLIIIFVIYSNIIISQASPGGSVVFDPQNLKTAVESLATLRQQIKTSKEAVRNMINMRKNIDALRNEIAVIYNSNFGVLGEFNELKKEIEKTPANLQRTMDEFKGNDDCVFSDIDAYMQSKNMWNAKYFYGKDPEKLGEGLIAKEIGFDNNIDSREQTYKTLAKDPKRGLYIKERKHSNTGTNSMTGLVHGKCGLTRTIYHDAYKKLIDERAEFFRVTARVHRNLEVRQKEMKDWLKLADRVSGKEGTNVSIKAMLDTQMKLQWQMVKILHRIDQNIAGIYMYGTNLEAKQDQNVKNLVRAARQSLTEQQLKEARQRMPDKRGTGTPHLDAMFEERKKSSYYKRYNSGPLFR